jgi:hypothetical protein
VFISLRTRIRQAFLLGCVSGAALLVLAVGQASAATYPSGGSTFTGSAEGWKEAASECKLLGIIELLCTNGAAYDGTAGSPPGSFAVTTEVPINLISLFKSEVTSDSPTFVAAGGGTGSLSLSRSFIPGGLLTLAPEFTYTANLVDKTTNTKQKAITEAITAEAPFATKTGGVSLTAGHTYQIEIEATTTSTLASVGLLGGAAIGRFDDVVVTGPNATENPNGNPGENGGNGGNGNEGGAGAGGVSSARLESLIQSSSLVGPAILHGSKLSVKAKCPSKVGVDCTITLQGMLSRNKPATATRKAKVRVGKTKNFALTVKPAARSTVKTKKKLLFKETVKAGQSTATVFKALKLVHK